MATEFHGTIYNAGDIIPGYVDDPIQSMTWWDDSKTYQEYDETSVYSSIWQGLGVDIKVWMGDEYDDMIANDEVLNDIMQYFNLHIIQIGYDFYIFDWESIKSNNNISWCGLTSQAKHPVKKTITVEDYKSSGTNISMAEVYNQLKATCTIDKFDEVISSPFEDDDLYSKYYRPQLYMREHVVEGTLRYPANEFARIILNKNYVPQGSEWAESIKDSYFVEWWMQVMQNDKWSFKLNGVDNYNSTNVYADANGVYYDQWKLLDYIQRTPFASGIIKWGHGDKRNWKNWTQVENITNLDTYIVIGVHGNGLNEHYNYATGGSGTHPGGGFIPIMDGTPTPTTSDLQNANMSIEYHDSTEIDYSPTDDDTTNYLIFSGNFVLQPFIQKTGSNYKWFDPTKKVMITDGSGVYERLINYDHLFKAREDLNTFENCYNTLYNLPPIGPMDTNNDSWDQKGYDYLYHNKKYVGSKDNDEGRYYQQLYYGQQYSGVTPDVDYSANQIRNKNLLSPPVDYGDLFKLYKYDLGKKSYYKQDVIDYVPVFECELKIGNKYWVEFEDGDIVKTEWREAGNLPTYVDDVTGLVTTKSTFALGFNPKGDEYIIGDEHEFLNNINTSMGLTGKGTGIPIKKSDEISGDITFKIVGLVNTYWDNGIRRHPTWFRPETLSTNNVPILSHVRSVLIKNFDVKFESDNGGYTVTDDKDLVYVSAETNLYVNKKDDIEFRINTALTSEEAYRAGTTTTINKNNIMSIDGSRILNFTNKITNEIGKGEQHYIDSYYREYNQPKLIIETDVKIDDDINEFNKYVFNYFNGKSFFPMRIDYNLYDDSVHLVVKEI